MGPGNKQSPVRGYGQGHDVPSDLIVAEILVARNPYEQDATWTAPSPGIMKESLTPNRRQQEKVDRATVTREEKTKDG